MSSLIRTAIELFYREPISASLVALDNDGRYRKAIERLESCGLTRDEDLVREHLARVGDEPLDPRARFVRRPPDIAPAIVYLLHATPLLRGVALRPAVTAMTKDDLADFATALLVHRKVIENVLGIDVRADLRKKPFTSLNTILRMIGLRMRNTRRRRVNGRI